MELLAVDLLNKERKKSQEEIEKTGKNR